MNFSDDKQRDNETVSRLMDGEWQDLKAGECLAGVCQSEAMKGSWERYHLIRDVMRNEPVDSATTLCDRISAAIADEPAYSNVHAIGASATLPAESKSRASIAAAEEVTPRPAASATPAAAVAGSASRSGGPRSSGMRTAFTGFALAASVALVTVLGLSVWQDGALPEATQQVAVTDASNTFASASAPVPSDSPDAALDATDVFSLQIPGSPLPEVDFVANSSSFWVSPETTKRAPSEGRLNLFLSQHIEHSPTSDLQGMFPYSRLVGYEQQVAE